VFTFLGIKMRMAVIISMLIMLGMLHHSQPLINAQVSDSNQLTQSDILISDYELTLNTQTATYDTYDLVHDRFPYLEKDYDYLVAISDMQLLNMSFVLSMLDVLNQQKSTTNILNLASGEIFPDPEVFGCQMHDMARTEDANHKEESAHEEFPNVCNSQVTNISGNKEQYKALAVTLNTLRQQHAQQRISSPVISERIELPTIAMLAVNDVLNMIVDKQLVQIQSRISLISKISQTYIILVPQSQIHRQHARLEGQSTKNELLSPDERIAFINSLNLQWPWSNDENICLGQYIHGSGFSGGEKTNGYDFGKCTKWEWGKNAASQVFDVKSMSDGVRITNKHENSPTSSNYYCTDNMVVMSTTKKFNNKDHTFYAVYYHLETPSTKNEYKKGDTVARIAHIQKQAEECSNKSEHGPHLHLSMFIDSYDLHLTDASNFPMDGWEIGGWRYTLKLKNTSNYEIDNGEYTSYTNICDKNVLGKSLGASDKRGPIKNLCSTPDQKFTLRQSNDETTNGRWPKLEWSYSGSTPVAYYLEVTKQEDTYWGNPVVYECIKPSSLLWWWQTNNYVPTSIDFQTERTGVFKWRVRSSDVLANDMNACNVANRGKWDKWSTEKTFTNRGLQTQYPGNSEKGFFQTFLSFDLSSILSRQSRTMPTVQGYQLKIGQLGKTNPIIVRCSNNSSITVPLNQMSSVSGMHWYTISVLTQPWTDNTCAQITGLYESYPRFFDNRIELAKNILWSPTNGYISSNGLWPELLWQTPQGADATFGYRIQVSRSQNFATTEVDECVQTASYLPKDNWWSQSRTGVFYWRVNYVPQAWSTQTQCKGYTNNVVTWSTTQTFVNPITEKKAQLIAPAMGFTSLDGLWPQLQWNPRVTSLGQYGYRIQVSKNRNFTGTLTVDECRTTNSYKPTLESWMRDPERNGEFFWRVNYLAQPWNGDSKTCQAVYVEPTLWSEWRTFVNRPPVNPVVLVTADALRTNNGLWPQLQWSNGTYMTTSNGYRIQISRDRTFGTTEVDQCTNDNFYVPQEAWWAAERTGVYYWRVNYMQKPWVGTISSSCKDATKINNQLWSVPRTFENPPVNVVPQLTAPAEGAQNPNGLWYQLQWNPGNATLATYGYRIQVSKNRNFTGTLTVDECRTTKGYQSTDENWMRAPERNGEFFWRINYVRSAWNNEQDVCKRQAVSATWSEVRSFKNVQPTNPVALSSPADGYRSNNGLWPQLQWSNGAYMTTSNGYRIQISRDRTFGTTEVDQCTNDNFYVPQEAWWAAELTGVYYWRVNYMQKPWIGTMSASCKDASKINGQLWSVPRTFENPPVNVVPQLTAPAAGAQSPNGLWYQLQWNPGNVTLATYGYRIQVSKNRNFTGTLTVDECRTTNGYQSTDENWMRAPERNGEFFWRINYVRSAWNNDQDVCKRQAVSATWSEVRSFKNVQPTNPVVITAPANGTATSDGSWPRIEWTNGAYMGHIVKYGYRIQVSQTANFSNPIVDECTMNIFYISDDVWWMLGLQGQFYYRVNYVKNSWNNDKTACKQQSTDARFWSDSSRTFTNGVSNIRPQLTEPSDGMTSQDGLWPTLRWQPVRNALAQYGYRIQVSKSRAFTNNLVDECSTDSSYRPKEDSWMRDPERNGELYWRVNYVPKQWNGNMDTCKKIILPNLWSMERKFVNRQPVNPVVATSPSSGNVSTNGAWPRIEWTNGAYMGYLAKEGYRVQISTSSSFTNLVVDECLAGTSYSANNFWWEQSQKGTYYWRVNYMLKPWSGANSDSCKDSSKINSALWSQWRTFTNPNDDRSTRASSPSSGHTTSDGLWPTISWSPYSSGYAEFGYRIQMSPNSDFSSLYVDECTNSTSYRPSGSSSEKFMRDKRDRIYWRINYMIKKWDSSTCKNSSGINNSWWSSSRYFNNPMPQNKVVLTSPSDGYTSSGGIWPTLQWSAGSNMSYYYPHGYYIEVSKNSSFTDLIVNQCTTTTSYKPADNWWMQTFRMRLYWRISYVPSAWNGNQNTCKSMSFSSSLRSNSRSFLNP
jgi:hypothetical protein